MRGAGGLVVGRRGSMQPFQPPIGSQSTNAAALPEPGRETDRSSSEVQTVHVREESQVGGSHTGAEAKNSTEPQ